METFSLKYVFLSQTPTCSKFQAGLPEDQERI